MASVITARLLARNSVQFLKFNNSKYLPICSSLYICCNNSSNTTFHNNSICYVFPTRTNLNFKFIDVRHFSHDEPPKKQITEKTEDQKEKKLSLFQRFKEMYKKYWYVLVPVHLVTSAFWFGGFYYLAKSGVDIPALLESWNVSEKLVNPLRDSSMGYVAVAYALYKISTPARYTVTLGGTTISINYLKKWGYIKPVPSRDELKEMYKERKENIMESVRERRDEFRERRDDIVENLEKKFSQTASNIKDKKDHLVEDIEKSIKQTQQQLKDKKDDIMEDIGSGLKKVKEGKK